MAVYHGKGGKVTKNDVTVININAWTINDSLDTEETTAYGSTSKKHGGGLYGWGGSFEGFADPANTEQAALWTALKNGDELTDVKFYIDATHYYSGNLLITGISRRSGVAEHLKATFTFLGSGDLSYT